MCDIDCMLKPPSLSNPQGLPLGTHANTGLLNLLITGTDYKDFKNLDEILLDLVNYDDNELRRISFKILQRNYSDFEETGEFLNSALILKSNQSISLYRQIISLITRLGVIPRVFFTEGDIKAVIGILDELAAKCRQNVMEASDNISLSSLTAQMILGNFDVHELLIERLKEIRDSQSVSSDTKSKLYASSAKFLHRLVQGNDAMKLPLMENLDSLILLLEEPKCADLFEEVKSIPKEYLPLSNTFFL